MSELICHAYDCTIRQYMDSAFLNRRKVLIITGEPTEEEITAAFEQIQEEFNDLMIDESQFRNETHYLIQIYLMEQQIRVIETSLAMQRNFLDTWGEPFEEGMIFINANYAPGRKLNWTGDVEAFKQQLNFVENRHRVKHLYLADAKTLYQRELEERRRKNKATPAQTQQQSFGSFMNLLSSMKANGFSFDKEKDTLMELGFAVRMLMTKKAATAE